MALAPRGIYLSKRALVEQISSIDGKEAVGDAFDGTLLAAFLLEG